MIKKPGIYRDFDVAKYHADPCPEPSLRQSDAKLILEKSPLHVYCKNPRLGGEPNGEREYEKAKIIGDAAHALMIGRGKDISVCEDFSDWRRAEARDWRDHEFSCGRLPILADHFAKATALVGAAKSQLDQHQENDCFKNGAGEVALIWKEGPLWFRCLVDWLQNDLCTVDDYKTSGMSVAPHVLGMRAVDAGWDIQAAMIERGLIALDPKNAGRRKIRFIAQEQDAPNALSVMVMSEHWLTMGRKKLDYAVAIWSDCIRKKDWPGYPRIALTPEYPGFKETQWLNREVDEADTFGKNINILAAG